MGPRHLAYVAMLAFCLAGTLPLVVVFRLRALAATGRVALAIALASAPFVLWDVLATHAGQWRFDPTQTLPVRVLSLPLEELGFFVVIPLATLITYEAVRTIGGRGRGR